MEYVPIGATQKTDQRTSRMVELFISEGLMHMDKIYYMKSGGGKSYFCKRNRLGHECTSLKSIDFIGIRIFLPGFFREPYSISKARSP